MQDYGKGLVKPVQPQTGSGVSLGGAVPIPGSVQNMDVAFGDMVWWCCSWVGCWAGSSWHH